MSYVYYPFQIRRRYLHKVTLLHFNRLLRGTVPSLFKIQIAINTQMLHYSAILEHGFYFKFNSSQNPTESEEEYICTNY